jgi:CheY-like chemotaxis protein
MTTVPPRPVNRRVLYIEDNENNIRLVERLLKRRPQVELRVATNARDGVRAAHDEQAALILLDNHLPDATGTEVLSQLASSAATAAIPVVIVSGDSDSQTATALRAAGAADYLAKPFDIHLLMAIIDRYLP